LELHTSPTISPTVVAQHLGQPWAAKLRCQLVPDPLIETIATWRALHGVDDNTRPLGGDPSRRGAAPDHPSHLAVQIHDTLNQVHHDLDDSRAWPLLDEPPAAIEEARSRARTASVDNVRARLAGAPRRSDSEQTRRPSTRTDHSREVDRAR
jgi:hypothetical protein